MFTLVAHCNNKILRATDGVLRKEEEKKKEKKKKEKNPTSLPF